MSARRPNYTAVADGTAPDFELTSQRSSDRQPAEDDKSRGESSTRNPLVENSDTEDDNDVEKGTGTTATKQEEEDMMDLRCLDLQVREMSPFLCVFGFAQSPTFANCVDFCPLPTPHGSIVAGENV